MLSNIGETYKKWWFWPLLAGVLIRLILMPITLHVDLWGHSFTAYFLAYEGKLNPYEVLTNLPQDHPIVRNFGVGDIFIYPPLTFFTLGFFRLLIKPFADSSFLPFVMEFPGRLYERSDLFLNLFLYKLPYLFIDIGLAFLLTESFSDFTKKKWTFVLWMLNPVTLYATFMIGQIDILPTFFTVLAMFLAVRKKYFYSMISLGMAASYKTYPLLFVPPAAFLFGTTFKERIKYMAYGIAPFVLTILPYLYSSAFRSMVLFSPKSQKMLFMGWNLSGAEVLFPFIISVFLIYFLSFYSKASKSMAVFFCAILLGVYSVTHYHPQWFLWITPFLIWNLVEANFKYWEIVLIFAGSWIILTLFFEPSLSLGLFNPVNPALNNLQSLEVALGKYMDVFQLKSVVRSIFAAASIYYVYALFKNADYKK